MNFGNGYSSLICAASGSTSSRSTAPIVHAVVSLGRGLCVKVTAEGLDAANQNLFLRATSRRTQRFGELS